MGNYKKYSLNDYTVTKLKALAFHSSVRIRLKSMGTIKAKVGNNERIVGIKVRAQVIKNRMGPPLRSADFDILFDRGIDNYGSWLQVLKDSGLLKQAGAWYTYIDTETGEEIKFQSKDFVEILTNRNALREQIYSKICDATILQYRKEEIDVGELVIDDVNEID
jgi:recombination protein RecA